MAASRHLLRGLVPSAEQRSLPPWVVPLNRSGLAGRVFFLCQQVEELIGVKVLTSILRTAVDGELTLSPIASLFWNVRERRLRVGWRMLVFLVMTLVVAAVDGRVRAGLAGRLPDLYEDLVRALVFALLIATALYLASRVLDHRRMSDYGFHVSRTWWTDLGFGLVLGALLLFGVLAVELAMGWVNVTGSFAPAPGQPFVAHDPGRRRRRCGRSFRGGGVVSRIPDQEPNRGRCQSTVGDGHRCGDSSSLLWRGACDE